MKAEELMICDWVLDGKKPAQITGIMCCDYFETTLSPGVDGECISPIPLTAEILEKNGFVRFYVNYVNYWKMQVDNVYIELRPTEGNMAIWLDYDKDNDGIYANYILPYPDNLHQLQHALRLCNIEKEIEL